MSRVALTDGSGKWFSEETAEYFKEDTYFNGSNWISKATGKQSFHEGLYHTKGGKYILREFTDYAGGRDEYKIIDAYAAAAWFSINEMEPHDKCEKEFNDLEIE